MKFQVNKTNTSLILIVLKSLLLLLLFFGTVKTFCQSKDSISLSNRVKYLEDYQGNIEKLYQISAAKLESTIDDKISSKVKDIDEAKKTLDILVWVGIPGTIIGLLVAFFIATEKAKKFVVDKLQTIVEQKREEIIKLIQSQEYDSRLRKTKKLLVLSPDEASQEQLRIFMEKLNFSNTQYKTVNTYQNFKDYDLIIFNDYYTLFEQALMNQYLDHAQGEHISFVAYTKNKLNPDPRLNFSNSRFTLYHSILSTLKYAEILKSEES